MNFDNIKTEALQIGTRMLGTGVLATSERLFEVLGVQPGKPGSHSMQFSPLGPKKSGGALRTLALFGIGVGVGVGSAMYLSSKSGRELRTLIMAGVKKLTAAARSKGNEAIEEGNAGSPYAQAKAAAEDEGDAKGTRIASGIQQRPSVTPRFNAKGSDGNTAEPTQAPKLDGHHL